MTLGAISSYDFSVFLHLTAVVVGFGATFAESILFPVAMSMSARHLPYVHRLQLALNQYFATPAMVIVLATGLYQVNERPDIEIGDPWIGAGLGIVLVIGGLLGAYFIPADRKLGPMVEREIAAAGDGEVVLSEEYQRAARTEGIVGAVTGLLLVVAIYLMVVQPS
jgi:hypothetical protein